MLKLLRRRYPFETAAVGAAYQMIGREGSYLVKNDRENVDARRAAELAASQKISASKNDAAESELTRTSRPLDAQLPEGAGKATCRAMELLVHGNNEFRIDSYVSAIDSYSKGLVALSMAGSAEGHPEALHAMKVACLLNRASCLLHNERREGNLGQSYSNKALQDSQTVLALEPESVSAMVLRGLAYEAMELFEEAEEVIKVAAAARPFDYPLAALLPTLRERAAAAADADEDEIDWAKYGITEPSTTSSGASADPVEAASPEETLAEGLGVCVATDGTEGEPEPEQTLGQRLTSLADARPALRVKDYEKAAEAMIPKEPKEATEDDGDSWAAQAYGDADFSAQEEEDKKKAAEINNAKDQKGDGDDEDSEDEDAPPMEGVDPHLWNKPKGGFPKGDSSGDVDGLNWEDDDGMPGLENPDA